jgi:hypothetical protein
MIITERIEPDVVDLKCQYCAGIVVGGYLYQEFSNSLPHILGKIVSINKKQKTITGCFNNLPEVRFQIKERLKKRKQTTATWELSSYYADKACLSFIVGDLP